MPTVLIVEDDDDIREVIHIALEVVAGWSVLVASGGREGIDLALAHVPDAIVLDMMMPGLDGLETFARLQADPTTTGIPVVLLTAKLSPGDDDPWAGVGICGVITKPFDPITLGAQVSDLVGWADPSPGLRGAEGRPPDRDA